MEKQGEGASEGGAICDLCNRTFGNWRRLLVLLAIKHREIVNAATKEDQNSRRLVRWTPSELLDLAQKEATSMKKGGRFINEALKPLCPGRSL